MWANNVFIWPSSFLVLPIVCSAGQTTYFSEQKFALQDFTLLGSPTLFTVSGNLLRGNQLSVFTHLLWNPQSQDPRTLYICFIKILPVRYYSGNIVVIFPCCSNCSDFNFVWWNLFLWSLFKCDNEKWVEVAICHLTI